MSAETCTTHHRACDCIEAERMKHRIAIRKASDTARLLGSAASPLANELRRLVDEWLDWEDGHDADPA